MSENNQNSSQTNDPIDATTTDNDNGNSKNDNQSVIDRLDKFASVLVKLADTPDDVNAEGLKHLAEQASELKESYADLHTTVENTTKVNRSLESQFNELKFELAKRDVIAAYDLAPDLADLITASDVDGMKAQAEKLAKLANQNNDNKLDIPTYDGGDLPPHLKKLL